MEDNVTKLYNALRKKNYTDEELGGSEKDFREGMKDPQMRKSFYDWVSNRGDFQIGDFDSYEERISSDYPAKEQLLKKTDSMLAQNQQQQQQVEDFNQRIDNMQEYGLGLGGNTKKGQKQYNSLTGKFEDTYLTPAGNRYTSKSDADNESLQYRQILGDAEKRKNEQGYVEGFIPGIKQGWNSLVEGAKYLAGETANVFTGSSLDDAQALDEISRMEKEGLDLNEGVKPLDEIERKYYELLNDDVNAGNKDISDEQRCSSQEAIRRDNIHSYIRDVLEESGGDWDKAKQLLTERAADKSWGDEVMQNASAEMNKARPTKGFGAWVGNLVPQMAPSAAAIALSFVTKNPKYAKMVGGIGMGGMTAATAGQSMKEARDAGATNGQTWAVGIADGAIEYATEMIPFDRYTSRLFNGTKKKVAKEMAEAVTDASSPAKNELEKLLRKANDKLGGKLFSKENAKKYLTDIATEGVSEFSAEALQTITPMIYQSPEEYPTITEILQNGWEGAKGGLFMGAVLGGASKSAEYYQNRQRRKEQGFVDVAEVQFSDKDTDIAEILGKDVNGNFYAMRDGKVETVTPDQVVQAHHYTFDEFENGRIEIEADEAWDEGYNVSNAPDMQDVKNTYESKKAELTEQMGVEAESLDDEIGDPLSFIQEQRKLGKTVDELQPIIDYMNAKYAYDGMQQKASDDIESQVTASNSDIDSRTSKTDGMVHPAVMKSDDREVFIVDGHVNMTDDGTMVDVHSSDETILVKDKNTGEVKFASPSDVLNVSRPIDASLQKITEEQRIRNEYQQKFDDDVNGRITQFNAGDPYTLTDNDGNQTVVTLTPDENGFVENPNGTVNFVREGGKDLEQMSKDELQQMFDNTNKKRAADQENERKKKVQNVGGDKSEQNYKSDDEFVFLDDDKNEKKATIKGRKKYDPKNGLVPDDNGNIVEYSVDGEDDVRHSYIDELNGKVVSYSPFAPVASPAVKNTQETPSVTTNVVESNAAGDNNSALQRVPKDEKGNPVYEETDNETAWDAILEQTNNNEAIATTVAQSMLADKEAELNKLEKVKSKGGATIAEKIASEQERVSAIEQARKAVEAWKKIAETGKQRRKAKEAERQKALHEEAVKQVNAEREAQKIADAERAAVGNENPMPAISEKWNKANKLDGTHDEIVLPNGERIKGHYVLHEAGASSPSHQSGNGFQKTEGFPMDEAGNTVNDRDYEGDTEAQRVTRDIAGNYDQRALQTPIVVSKDGVVLSGNGRTMAGEIAAQGGTDTAYNDYLKQFAAKYGFTPEQVGQMQHPRVAFVPDEAMPYTAETFAKFNQQEMKSQNKTEHAVKLGKTVPDDTFGRILKRINHFETLGDFYNDTAAGTSAIKELVSAGVIPQAQLAEMTDGDKLSAVGRETLENVLIGKSFEGDPNAVRMLSEVPSMRQSVIFALSENSNNLSLGDNFTLKNELTEAIKLCYDARVQGKIPFGEAVSAFARQGNLFASPDEAQTVADYQNAVVMMLADVLNDKRVSQLKKVIATYNKMATDSANGQLDIFSGKLKGKEEIINEVLELLNYGTKEQTTEPQQAEVEHPEGEAVATEQPADETGNAGTSSEAEQVAPSNRTEDISSYMANLAQNQPKPQPASVDDDIEDIKKQIEQNSKYFHERAKEVSELYGIPEEHALNFVRSIRNDMGAIKSVEVKQANTASAMSVNYENGQEVTISFGKQGTVNRRFDNDGNQVGSDSVALQTRDANMNEFIERIMAENMPKKDVSQISSTIEPADNIKFDYDGHRFASQKELDSYKLHKRNGTRLEDKVQKTLGGIKHPYIFVVRSVKDLELLKEYGISDDIFKALKSNFENENTCAEYNLLTKEIYLFSRNEELRNNVGLKGTLIHEIFHWYVNRGDITQEEVHTMYEEVKSDMAPAFLEDLKQDVNSQEEFEEEVVAHFITHYVDHNATNFLGKNYEFNTANDAFEKFIDLINDEYGKEEKRTNSNDSRGNQVSQKQAQSGNGTSQNLETGSSEQSEQQRVKAAESEVNTNPTESQKAAGNYKMGHVKIDGYDITIENPKGSVRSKKDANGNVEWSVTMNNTYGYIRGTEGVDGDHIDVFLSDHPEEGDVYIVDQLKEDGTFDEHKVMYGFKSHLAAKRAYLANYSPGWKGLGTVTRVSKEDFKKWINSSHRKTKPFAEYNIAKKESNKQEHNIAKGNYYYAEGNGTVFKVVGVNGDMVEGLVFDMNDLTKQPFEAELPVNELLDNLGSDILDVTNSIVMEADKLHAGDTFVADNGQFSIESIDTDSHVVTLNNGSQTAEVPYLQFINALKMGEFKKSDLKEQVKKVIDSYRSDKDYDKAHAELKALAPKMAYQDLVDLYNYGKTHQGRSNVEKRNMATLLQVLSDEKLERDRKNNPNEEEDSYKKSMQLYASSDMSNYDFEDSIANHEKQLKEAEKAGREGEAKAQRGVIRALQATWKKVQEKGNEPYESEDFKLVKDSFGKDFNSSGRILRVVELDPVNNKATLMVDDEKYTGPIDIIANMLRSAKPVEKAAENTETEATTTAPQYHDEIENDSYESFLTELRESVKAGGIPNLNTITGRLGILTKRINNLDKGVATESNPVNVQKAFDAVAKLKGERRALQKFRDEVKAKMKEAEKQQPKQEKPQQELDFVYELSVQDDGTTVVTRSAVMPNGVPIGDGHWKIRANNPAEMKTILISNGMNEILDKLPRLDYEVDKWKEKTTIPDDAIIIDKPETWVGRTFFTNGMRLKCTEVDKGYATFDNLDTMMGMGYEVKQVQKYLRNGEWAGLKDNAKVLPNRLVTDERYEELRRKMLNKLKGQMNIGIDPEILSIGTEMAIYHIEKGARKFDAYARAMIADLGDVIRPYLKSFYNAVRDYPDIGDLPEQMTPYEEVSAFDVANFDKPHTDVFETAATIAREEEVKKEVKKGKEEIAKHKSLSDFEVVSKMMPEDQQKVVQLSMIEHEPVMERLEKELSSIPGYRENEDHTVYAHYFGTANTDVFVLEYDPEYDEFYTYTVLNGDSEMSEFGTIGREQLTKSGIELDFYWDKQKLGDALRGIDAEFFDDFDKEGKKADKILETTDKKDNFVKAVKEVISRSEDKIGIVRLRSMASDMGLDLNDIQIQELTELAIVDMAREEVQKLREKNTPEAEIFKSVVDIYNAQPTISMRSSGRVEKQQYSTPIPLAYAADMFVNAGKPKSVLEPSAGNGMMVFGVNSAIVTANEIDNDRLANLRKQGFANVTNQDATLKFEKKYDGIVTNPPFGSKPAISVDGYRISGLDEQMVVNALDSMNDNGRASIIIGGHTKYSKYGAAEGSERPFLNYLYSHFNVVDIINVNGDLYSKQGTKFPVRLILIDGKKAADETLAPVQSKARAEVINTFDELFNRVNNEVLPHSGTSTPNNDNGGKSNDAELDNGGNTASSSENKPSNGGKPLSGRSGQAVGSKPAHQPGKGQEGNEQGAKPASPSQRNNGNVRTSNADGTGEKPANEGNGTAGTAADTGRRGNNDGRVSEQPSKLDREPLKVDVTKEKTPYPKRSQSVEIGSVVPTNTAIAIDEVLDQFDDIDAYVMDKLGYGSKDELFKALSAEQIDSVALAIKQMEDGHGFIIGDMTGVGKGRQAAALIRYAIKQGMKPVFMTEKANLFSDIYRDLRDIGSPEYRPFIFNDKNGNNDPTITDEKGNVVYKVQSPAEKKKVFESGVLPEDCDFAVITYSQLNTNDQKKFNPKKKFFKELVEGNILIMDESHNAGGEGNTGKFLQDVVPTTKGVTFLSGTFAKRADNMPIYALKTNMSDANMTTDELIEAILSGGVPLQEIMSRNLVESGQMIRRERDYTGVNIDWLPMEGDVERQKTAFNNTIELFNDIIHFQRKYIDTIIDERNEELAELQQEMGKKKGTKDLGISNVPFASKTFNLVRQLLFSLKAEYVADKAIESMKEGLKPLIAVANTMEGFMNEVMPEGTDTEAPDFSIVFEQGLESVMKITTKDAKGNEEHSSIPLSDLSEEGQKEYARLKEKMRAASVGLSVSPIDVIKDRIRRAGYSVGELTGRTFELQYNDDGTVRKVKRQDTDKKKQMRQFNNGELDMLILNQSASTGISLHASTRFKDQRQRIMIFAQNQLDVNTEIQMRGRSDRTGQVHRSKYLYVVSPIPAEGRLMMMFKSKLKSLDANTTSSQKSKVNEMEIVDFLNKYGDQVVVEYLKENRELADKLLDPLHFEGLEDEKIDKITASEGDASKVAGRVALLNVEGQEAFYKEIAERYNTLINYLNETGSNDLEITTMPLRAETKSKRVIVPGKDPDSSNSFAQDSYLEEVEIDILKKPMKAEEVRNTIEGFTKGKTPKEYRDECISKVEDYKEREEAKLRDKFNQELPEKMEKARETAAKKAAKATKSTEEEKAQLIEKAVEAAKEKAQSVYLSKRNRLAYKTNLLKQVFGSVPVGRTIMVPSQGKDGNISFGIGVLLGFKINDKMTPSTTTAIYATLDGRRKVEIPLSKSEMLTSIVAQTRMNLEEVNKVNLDNWDEQIPDTKRKKAYIVTGNILQAMATVSGQLVSYSTIDGTMQQGILLPDSFKPGDAKKRVPITEAQQDIEDCVKVSDATNTIELERKSRWDEHFYLRVPMSKTKGGKFFLDKELRRLSSNGDFFQKGNKMEAGIPMKSLKKTLKLLSDKFEMSIEVKALDDNSQGVLFRVREEGAITDEQVKALNQAHNGEAVVNEVNRLSEILHTPIRVEYDENNIPGNDSMKRKAKGWFNPKTGEIVVFAPNAESVDDAVQTVLHEAVAHKGLRKLFGEHFNTFLENVYNNASKGVRSRINALMAKNGWNMYQATDEYLASLAERTNFEDAKKQGWWKKVKDFFIEMLAKAGVKLPTLTDNELRYILWRSYENLKNGPKGGPKGGIFTIAEDIAMQSELEVGNYAPSNSSAVNETKSIVEEAKKNGTYMKAPNGKPSHLNERQWAQVRTKSFKKWFGDWENDPDIRFRTNEKPSGDAAREYNKAVRTPNNGGTVKGNHNIGYRLREAYQDSMLALKKLQEAIAHETGKKVNDFENAYMAENRMSSINNTEKEVYMRDYMHPLFDAVSKLLSDGKSTLDDINNYLMAKHGLERNEYFREKAAREAADKWANDTIKAEMANGKDEDEAKQIADAGKEAIYDEVIDSLQDADYSGLTELTQLEDEEVNEEFTERAEKLVADFEGEHDVSELWDTINAATNESLKKSYKSGMLSLENYEYIKNMFDYYVPLRGWDNNEAGKEYDYLTNNRMHLSPAVIKMRGRKSKADNVLAFIGFSGESSIIQGNRNKMKQHLLNLVVNHPTDLARASKQWYVLDNATGEWEERYPSFPDDATPEQINAIVDSFNEKMLDLKDKGLAKQGKINLSTGMHIKRSEQPEHIVKVMRNGQPMNVYINGNPRAAQAVNGILNPDNVSDTIVHQWAQTVKHSMARNFTSRNPAFVVSNLSRDVTWAVTAVSIKEDKTYSKRFRNNLRKILLSWKTMPLLKKFENGTLDENNEFEKYFKEFLMNGGETGFTAINTVEDYKRDINRYVEQAQKGVKLPKQAWRKLWDSVELINRSVEDVSRFATYMTSRQQGRSIERSIWDAKEITVNFNKKGSGEFGARYFNFAYVFFNASIQSIANIAKLTYNNPGKMGKTAGKFVALGMLFPAYSILASMLMGDDDEDKDAYFDLPKWVRENNMVFYIPFSNKKFITIPLPHELRPFYAIGENALCTLMGKDEPEDALKRSIMSFTSLLPLDLTGHDGNQLLNLTPTAALPFAEIVGNKDFFGKPIYKDSPFNQLKPEWQRAYAGTNPYLINGMKVLNSIGGGNNVDKGYWLTDINPAKIEHLFEGYLGGMGKFINKTANFVSMAWDEDSRMMRNVPVVGSFVQDADPRFAGSTANNTYFSHKEELQELQHKISGYQKEMKMAYGKKDEAEYKKYESYLQDFYRQNAKRYGILKSYINQIDGMRGAKEFVNKENQKILDSKISSLQRELDQKLERID